MGRKGGIPEDIPDEYHWRDINRDIFDSKSILILKFSLGMMMPPQSSIPLPSIRIHAQNGEDPPWNWNFGDVGLSPNDRLFCQ